ncbi:MAG: hypothetical protein DRJ05_12735, partial [Bacteroidetes bacterium]
MKIFQQLLIYAVVLQLLLFYLSTNAQSNRVSFDFLDFADGQLQTSVNCITEDQFGFMWFGTMEKGLFQYDGNKYINYKPDAENSNNPLSNTITSLCPGSKGGLWVGTKKGLSMLNRATGEFRHYKYEKDNPNSLPNEVAASIIEDGEGNIWVGTYQGLCKISGDNYDKIERYYPFPSDMNSKKNHINAIYIDSKERFWLGSPAGFYYFNRKTNEFISSTHVEENPRSLSDNDVFSICETGDGVIWVGTVAGGLNKMNQDGKETTNPSFLHFMPDDSPNSLPHVLVRYITKDKNGSLWIATYRGLSIIRNPGAEIIEFENYFSNTSNSTRIVNNYTRYVVEDTSENIWVATDGGVCKTSNEPGDFLHYFYNASNNDCIAGHDIFTIAQDNSGAVWIGSSGVGITKLSSDEFGNDIYKHIFYDPNKPNGLAEENINEIFVDNEGKIWIGTFNGINILNQETGKMLHYKAGAKNSNGLLNNYVYSITQDKQNNYWMASWGGGLTKIRKVGDEYFFEHFFHDKNNNNSPLNNVVKMVCNDGENGLWIAYRSGEVSKVEIDENGKPHFYHVNSGGKPISGELAQTFFIDNNGYLWSGSEYGLAKVKIENYNKDENDTIDGRQIYPEIKYYETKDGLPGTSVFSILQDKSGFLWFATNNGLSKFDPVNETYEYYYKGDGLQSNEFNSNAALLCENGEMFFGGINGINRFFPDSIKHNEAIPPVVFTGMKILNKPVAIGEADNNGKISLSKSLLYSPEIELSHKDYLISFEFASLNLKNPGLNQYAYMLEGLDNDWVFTGNDNTATFTNLDAGTYTLKVKASNNNGYWNEEGASLTIIQNPPPWKTWWAYTLYILTVGFLISVFVVLRMRNYKQKLLTQAAVEQAKIEERERMRLKSAADFHDENGTALTKISLFTELAKREAKKETKIHLEKIEQNVATLAHGIRDFIWSLDPKKDSLYETFIKIREFGVSLFEYSSINFKTVGNDEKFKDVFLQLDYRRQLLFIFKEAINNCY